MSEYSFEIFLLVGAGPIKFGMSRREAREALREFGDPITLCGEDWYLDHRMCLSYTDGDDNRARVHSIEFDNRSPEGPVKVFFHGKNLFELPYEECRHHVLFFSTSNPVRDYPHCLGIPELDLMLDKFDYLARYRHEGHFNILGIGEGNTFEWDDMRQYNPHID